MSGVKGKKPKVLAVVDSMRAGGAERQFLELAKRLDRERFDLTVYLTEGGGPMLDEAFQAGLDVRCPWREPRRNTTQAFPGLLKCMRETGPDIIMAWLSYSITLAAAAALLTGNRNLLLSERSSLEYLFDNEVAFGALKKFIFKRAFRRGKLVTTNSKVVAEEFVSCGYSRPERTRVVYNGVDLERFSALPSRKELRAKLGLSEDAVYGIFAGKLEFRKGVTFLIEALDRIDRPGFEFLVIGTGSLESKVRAHPKFNLLGYKPNSAEYIKAADFLVLPSIYEGLPNVILEAMAVGTPVVATGVSGIPELIEDGKTGILVPDSDSAGLEKAIREMAGNVVLRGSLAGTASRKIRDFSMQKMVLAYEYLFEEILSCRR